MIAYDQNQLTQAAKHYRDHYEVVAQYSFAVCEKVFLTDHASIEGRRCRFCHRGKPDVAFSAEAHAIPALLGNHSVFSNNECNTCNKFLADNYEDHLGKWSNYGRSMVGVQGRKMPTYKGADGSRVERDETGVKIHLPKSDPELVADLKAKDGPFEFTPPIDGQSQLYVPLRAAMALIKVACSFCPTRDLDQCAPAIDWLMGRKQASLTPFPVLFHFTPGIVPDAESEVILLRRRSEEVLWRPDGLGAPLVRSPENCWTYRVCPCFLNRWSQGSIPDGAFGSSHSAASKSYPLACVPAELAAVAAACSTSVCELWPRTETIDVGAPMP